MSKKYRRVDIYNYESMPIEPRALKKVVRHYYKGPHNVEIRFDNRLAGWGQHSFESTTQTHIIQLSPNYCSHNRSTGLWDFEYLNAISKLVKMNHHDTQCRVIQTILHELKHAEQCDRNPKQYEDTINKHESIIQSRLGYELGPLETEAEGWALFNFQRAFDRYRKWYDEYTERE